MCTTTHPPSPSAVLFNTALLLPTTRGYPTKCYAVYVENAIQASSCSNTTPERTYTHTHTPQTPPYPPGQTGPPPPPPPPVSLRCLPINATVPRALCGSSLFDRAPSERTVDTGALPLQVHAASQAMASVPCVRSSASSPSPPSTTLPGTNQRTH
jgi:hypothetical protein